MYHRTGELCQVFFSNSPGRRFNNMHWMDRLVVAGSRSERIYPRLFPGGWGDDDALNHYREPVRSLSPFEPVDLEWIPGPSRAGLHTWEASFPSPAVDLPEPARIAHLLMVSAVAKPDRIVLLMAALNDHGFSDRFALTRHLARLGIASVLLENPLYGKRRANLHKQATRTVLDLLVMGRAATLEGVAVLDALRRSSDARLGVSGYSMGGNIAALVGSVNPFPIALAPLAPPHSPGPVFAQGVLSRTVKWGSLGGLHRREELGQILGSASALHFPAPPHSAYAVLAAPRSDGYIPRQTTKDLNRHWAGSELRWLPGGHASLWMFGKAQLAAAVKAAFMRLEQAA